MEKEPVLVIDKLNFVVKLYENLIEVDLKEGAKKELEDVIEAHPALRKSLGRLFQTVVPSDVDLTEIDSVEVDDKGQLKLVIPRHKDIIIPLEHDEIRKLAKELNELVPYAKSKEAASRIRFPLYFWWPDYYSYVIASDVVESGSSLAKCLRAYTAINSSFITTQTLREHTGDYRVCSFFHKS